jgi:hypothetical protein
MDIVGELNQGRPGKQRTVKITSVTIVHLGLQRAGKPRAGLGGVGDTRRRPPGISAERKDPVGRQGVEIVRRNMV